MRALASFGKKAGILIVSVAIILSALPYLIPYEAGGVNYSGNPYSGSGFMDLDGLSLHYRVFMPLDMVLRGKVLLIHGYLGSTYTWRNVQENLTAYGYMVVSVDLPSFGYSDRVDGECTMQGVVDRLWALLREIDGRLRESDDEDEYKGSYARWNLTGHDLGAAVAESMAVDDANGVQSLTFVSGDGEGPSEGALSYAMLYPPAGKWMSIYLRQFVFTEEGIRAFLQTAYRREPTDEEVYAHLFPLRISGTSDSVLHYLNAPSIAATSGAERFAKGVAEVADRVDVYAIWGEEDGAMAERMPGLAGRYPDVKLYAIPEAGHSPMETHHEEFIRILIAYLRDSYGGAY